MRFGISIPPFAPPADMVDLAVRADANGWDGVFVWDHLHFVRELRLPVHDPWVVLGAIAHATDRVRIGPLITPLARRRPAVVAKHVVTLDHLSGGRAVLGVGLGYPPADDFDMFGDEADDVARGDRLDEAVEVITRLWTAEPVRFDGAHHRIDAELHPAPVQRPRPPIWAGVMSDHERPRRRARDLDGVVPIGADGDPLTPRQLRSLVDGFGPTREGFEVVAAWGDGSVAEYEAAGATWLIEGRFPDGAWFDELLAAAGAPPGR